jgi:hypothetical protein
MAMRAPALGARFGPVASKTVDGGDPRLCRHTLGRNHYDVTSGLHCSLANVVEQVIDLGMIDISELDRAGHRIERTWNMALGFDQQRRDATDPSRLGDLRQIVPTKSTRSCRMEAVDQPIQSPEIVWLNELPGAVAIYLLVAISPKL